MRLLLLFAAGLLLFGCSAAEQVPDESDTTYASEQQIPEFKLPAPAPSVRANLPARLFGDPQRISDVSRVLAGALADAGYDDIGYYRVPNGFALVTETERIHDDGRPYEGGARFVFESQPLLRAQQIFDEFPRGFLERLRNADPGRYRVIVFLVTTRPVTTGRARAEFSDAEAWTDSGADFLPSAIGNKPFTADHNISVLVYEFRRASVGADPAFVTADAIPVRSHLRATGLLERAP